MDDGFAETKNVQQLLDQVADLCRRMGIPDWEKLLRKILDWMECAAGEERGHRFDRAKDLLDKIKSESIPFDDGSLGPDERDTARRGARSPEAVC